jgi:uncharacterized protein YjiS (DUF1127 family)
MMLRATTPQSGEDLWLDAEPARDAGGSSAWDRMVSGIRAYFAARARERRLREAEAQLQCLDDRMLKDLGIGRSEIRRVVRYGRHI